MVRRDHEGRQIAPDPCPGCLTLTKRMPRSGKRRYAHCCPHGVPCPWGVMPNATHINSYPPTGGCPACRVQFWQRDRAVRGGGKS